MHGKHGIKLWWSVMEPVLLVQTRVPAGDGGESKQGQGRVGGENE